MGVSPAWNAVRLRMQRRFSHAAEVFGAEDTVRWEPGSGDTGHGGAAQELVVGEVVGEA